MLTTNAHAIFGIEKILPDLNLFKQEVKGDINGIKVQNADMKSEITGLRLQVKDLSISLENNMNAIGQINGSIQKFAAGRDAIQGSNNVNDTDLMWKIIYGLLGVITLLIGNQMRTTRLLFKEMSNARFYQTQLAAEVNPDKLDLIMEKKKDLDWKRTMIGKATNAIRKITKSKKERESK
jgi:hypothetical protein